jgi:hypothetical protein
MCYEHHHKCKYCNKEYHCDLDNNICPSINYDADALMCDLCRKELERELKEQENKNG